MFCVGDNKMYKKIISIILVVIVVSLAGCNPRTEETTNQNIYNTEANTGSTTELTTIEGVGETTTQEPETSVTETTEAQTKKENINNVSQTQKKEESTQAKALNMKKYVGEWGSAYLCNGIYDYTLNINSITNNKIVFDLFFYRIASFDNQVITVDENGIARFDINDGHYRLAGKMKFMNNKIEMHFNENSYEWYKSKTFVFEKLGGASPYKIFNYIGKDLRDVVKSFGGGTTDFYAGGKFLDCESVDACFFYFDGDTGRYSDEETEKVSTIMAYGRYDYGYGLTCGKTYPELKKALAKYVTLEELKGFYSDEDGIYLYQTGPFYIDGQYISIEWDGDPYTTGASLIIFNGKI